MDPELGFGLIILVIGGLLSIRRLWFLHRAIKTMGTVVESSGGTGGGGTIGGGGGGAAFKTVQFQAQDGQSFTFTALGSATVGSRVSVFYHRRKPRKARINSFLQLWAAVLGWVGVGILIVIGAFAT